MNKKHMKRLWKFCEPYSSMLRAADFMAPPASQASPVSCFGQLKMG